MPTESCWTPQIKTSLRW